jgi:hypothetical protein
MGSSVGANIPAVNGCFDGRPTGGYQHRAFFLRSKLTPTLCYEVKTSCHRRSWSSRRTTYIDEHSPCTQGRSQKTFERAPPSAVVAEALSWLDRSIEPLGARRKEWNRKHPRTREKGIAASNPQPGVACRLCTQMDFTPDDMQAVRAYLEGSRSNQRLLSYRLYPPPSRDCMIAVSLELGPARRPRRAPPSLVWPPTFLFRGTAHANS